MGRGELVALLDAAPEALRTLRGTVRRWTHVGRARTASERANDRGGEPAELLIAWDGSGGMPPETRESESHVWYAAPNRWRVEGDDTTLYLSDGDQRWEGFTSFVTERGGPGEVPGLADSPPLADWLLPGALLGAYRFDEVTEVEAFGRRCLAATAKPRPAGPPGAMGATTMLAHAGYGGDEHRFVVDAEHGFVVRRTALVDGEPCAVTELIQLVVDEPIDPGLFRVPAGTTVQTLAEERARMLRDAGADPAAVDLADDAAVSRAMAGARRLAPPGGVPLAERARYFVPWGPPPDDETAAEAAIHAAFRDCAEASADGRDLVNVQAGEGLVEPLTLAGRRAPGAAPGNIAFAVDALRFVCPDEAVVWFSLEIGGERSPLVRERRGRAVRVGGRWLIERGTIAELLAFAGARVPPP